jgi:mRNA interferase MazF
VIEDAAREFLARRARAARESRDLEILDASAVSRQALIDSRFSTVVCAPVYTRRDGLATQVDLGVADGLKHESSIHCDALVSLPKSVLTDFVASLAQPRMRALDQALRVALALG